MPTKRKILVTSALIYANGTPHLGHLVGIIQADIWVRLQKMLGHECTYICGSDSHGTPNMIEAEKQKMTPKALTEKIHQAQVKDFADFHVAFDNYHFTHSEENRELVETVFARQQAGGHIAKHTIKQFFDPVKNMFLPDRYIKGECPRCHAKDQYGDNCESCGATYLPIDLINPYSTLTGSQPIEKESEHYFFKLQNFEEFLRQWTRNGHLQDQVTNKLDEWFKDGLREWDISRDAPYFGFTIPGEPNKYFYVWLDAPIGYMASFKNLCDRNKNLNFSDYWNEGSETELYHFIGKDIIYFHALFWPALLKGAQFRTPSAIFVNGFLTIEGQKMSKSRGTFIKARTYLNYLQPEYLRYYFAAKLSDKIEDLDINFDDFMQRINADLVGKYINIASRCAAFITKNFASKLSSQLSDIDLYHSFQTAGDDIKNHWDKMEYSQAIRKIMNLADRANQYIDNKKPWSLIKNDETKNEVQDICTMGINLFRLLTLYLKPVLPDTAHRVEQFLQMAPLKWEDKEAPLLNHTINEFQPLLQRIDPKQIEALKMATQQDIQGSHPAPSDQKEYLSIDDFSKVDLRVAKIISAEAIAEADKLLKLSVDLGGETRQIFAGIKSAYPPEELVGRLVVVVANLAPRKMRFGVSEGMVLAAGPGGDELWVISPDEGALAGMKVK
jgi:methionyl-tRNA synthetase